MLVLAALVSVPHDSLYAQVGGGHELLYHWDGGNTGDIFGSSVSNAGDVNGDGFDDLIVGARWAAPGGVSTAGSAFVYSGSDGSLLYQWNGTAVHDYFGDSVAAAGDFNADGFADLIVGASGATSAGQAYAGSAFVFSGMDGSVLSQWSGAGVGESFGMAVSGANDVNADGFDDVIVGAYGAAPGGAFQAGAAFVYSGADNSVLYQWYGGEADDNFGVSVSGAEDVNADGFDDVIVGARGTSPGGQWRHGTAYVYSGLDGSILHEWNGRTTFDYFGAAVSSAGDVNQDGFADLIVGAYMANIGSTGAAYVLSGFDGSLIYRWSGSSSHSSFGTSVSGVGDTNGDGIDDVLVGSSGANPHGIRDAGSAYLYSGADGSLLIRWDGQARDDWFGKELSGAGDVDGDGLADVIVSAERAQPGGMYDAGSVSVYSFSPYLLANIESISVSSSTQVDFDLDFPFAAASYGYKVLLSVSGPGQMFRGVDIPLTEDFMVHETYYGNYPFANYTSLHGTLSLNGDATATINIAAHELHPSLIGRTFYVAAAASVNGFTPAEFSSVAIPIEIAP